MTPDERREAVLDLMRQERFQWASPEHQWDTIMSHFTINEPAVADAIRYGLVGEMDCRELRKVNHALCINYPQPDDTSLKEKEK